MWSYVISHTKHLGWVHTAVFPKNSAEIAPKTPTFQGGISMGLIHIAAVWRRIRVEFTIKWMGRGLKSDFDVESAWNSASKSVVWTHPYNEFNRHTFWRVHTQCTSLPGTTPSSWTPSGHPPTLTRQPLPPHTHQAIPSPKTLCTHQQPSHLKVLAWSHPPTTPCISSHRYTRLAYKYWWWKQKSFIQQQVYFAIKDTIAP